MLLSIKIYPQNLFTLNISRYLGKKFRINCLEEGVCVIVVNGKQDNITAWGRAINFLNVWKSSSIRWTPNKSKLHPWDLRSRKLGRCRVANPRNRNLKPTDFLHTMISSVSHDGLSAEIGYLYQLMTRTLEMWKMELN